MRLSPTALVIEYPVTRPFPWKWAGLVGYLLIFILTVFITVVNALVGYETVSRSGPEFNPPDPRWYNKFLPAFRTNQSCDPAVYVLGDTFMSTFSLFEWKIMAMITRNNGSFFNYLEYRGEPLDGCAMDSVQIRARFQQWWITSTITARCELNNGVELFLQAPGPEVIDDPYESWSFTNSGPSITLFNSPLSNKTPLYLVQLVLYSAHFDILGISWGKRLGEPNEIRASYAFTFCPQSSHDEACSKSVVDVSQTTKEQAWYSIAGLDSTLKSVYDPLMLNLAQTVFAAVKLDFGNNLKNNIFLDTSLINDTLAFTNASNYELRDQFTNFADPTAHKLPLSANFTPAKIQTTYLCRSQKRKSAGNLIASVFAATSTVITGVWAVAVIVAAWWVKKDASSKRVYQPRAVNLQVN